MASEGPRPSQLGGSFDRHRALVQVVGEAAEGSCSTCKKPEANPAKDLHRAMNYLLPRLDEPEQRLYVGSKQ
jgi:hypothetical protein